MTTQTYHEIATDLMDRAVREVELARDAVANGRAEDAMVYATVASEFLQSVASIASLDVE